MTETVQLSTLRRTLRRTFGFRELREGQAEIISSILAGRDTLAIMPTGSRTSSPARSFPARRSSSPLISLMKDQVDKLG